VAKRPRPKKRRAARPKAKRAKVLKDLKPRGTSKDVKGGVTCIPLIAILIGLLTPQPDPPPPPPPPPPKLRRSI
jgi:hypothetical protein